MQIFADNFVAKGSCGVNKNYDNCDLVNTLKKQGKQSIKSDVNGSYTGLTIDSEKPVQDVDDL